MDKFTTFSVVSRSKDDLSDKRTGAFFHFSAIRKREEITFGVWFGVHRNYETHAWLPAEFTGFLTMEHGIPFQIKKERSEMLQKSFHVLQIHPPPFLFFPYLNVY